MRRILALLVFVLLSGCVDNKIPPLDDTKKNKTSNSYTEINELQSKNWKAIIVPQFGTYDCTFSYTGSNSVTNITIELKNGFSVSVPSLNKSNNELIQINKLQLSSQNQAIFTITWYENGSQFIEEIKFNP